MNKRWIAPLTAGAVCPLVWLLAARTPPDLPRPSPHTAARPAPVPATRPDQPAAHRPVPALGARPGPALSPLLDAASRTRIPASGVLVRLIPLEASGAETRGWVLPDGSWEGPAPAPGRYRVEARARGRGVRHPALLDLTRGRVVELPLQVVERVQALVRVLDAETRLPLTAARVWVWPAEAPPDGAHELSPRAGVFVGSDLAPGRWAVRVAAEGYLAAPVQVVELLQEPSELELSLTPATWVTGQVLGPEGPLEGARVAALGEALHGSPSVTSAAGGWFRLGPLAAGPHALRVSAPGHAAWQTRGFQVEPGGLTPPLRVVLTRGAALRGTVTGPQGQPVAGARVVAIAPGPTGLLIRAEARSDAAGAFTLPHLRPGPARVLADAPGMLAATPQEVRILAAGVEVVALRLEPGRTWRVRVVGGEGQPLPGAALEVSGWEGVLARGAADERGQVELAGLPAAGLRVSVRREGYLALGLELAAGHPLPDALTLCRPARLAGQLRPPALEGTVVRAEGPEGRVEVPVLPDGSWQLIGLPPGAYRLSARLFEERLTAPVAVELSEGEERRVALDGAR